jgi:hypothetical protein
VNCLLGLSSRPLRLGGEMVVVKAYPVSAVKIGEPSGS